MKRLISEKVQEKVQRIIDVMKEYNAMEININSEHANINYHSCIIQNQFHYRIRKINSGSHIFVNNINTHTIAPKEFLYTSIVQKLGSKIYFRKQSSGMIKCIELKSFSENDYLFNLVIKGITDEEDEDTGLNTSKLNAIYLCTEILKVHDVNCYIYEDALGQFLNEVI